MNENNKKLPASILVFQEI